jgi:hypothetical protein
MLKKWKTNRPIQNWKKGVTGFLWHWIIVFAAAQHPTRLPEINTRDGLPTASTRRVIELESGSILAATDGGLHFAPNNQPNLSRIKNHIGVQQCWDLHVNGNTLFVATYNNGLYLFDLQQGNLIQHYKNKQLVKIRRLRYIQGRLFCIARYGVYEIIGNKLTLRLRSDEVLPEGNMPMDVFIREQKLHVLNYPENFIYQQQANGHWQKWNQLLQAQGNSFPETYFNNLTAFQTDSQVFLGGVNYYTVIDAHNRWQLYQLQADDNESWAFWDFQLHNGQVYGAVSNTNDFNDGYLHLHERNKKVYNPPHNQSLWSISPSKNRDALWLATETNGIHLVIQPAQNRFVATTDNTQTKATKHYIVRHNSNQFLSIDYLDETGKFPLLESQTFARRIDRIREVVEINETLYLMGATQLWKYDRTQRKLTPILRIESFQWMTERNGLIWLFKPYNNVFTFDPVNKILTDKGYESKADCVRKSHEILYYHIMGKGFAYIDVEGKQHLLQANRTINQYTLNFEVVKDLLIIENGNAFDLYKIDLARNQITYLKQLNLLSAFRDVPILQINSDGDNIYLYSGDYLVEIALSSSRIPIQILRQQYLGHWRINGPMIKAANHFIIDRGNSVQYVEFEKQRPNKFEIQYGYNNEASSFSWPFFQVNTEKNFKITIHGSRYFDHLRTLYSVDMVDVENGQNQYGFFRGDAYYWFNGIGKGKFNLAVSCNNKWNSQFIIGTIDFYRDFPFWLMLVSLLSLLYWVFYNQVRTQESQQKRIATLQLKTLQSNFNPHFIYNSMSLIQSLIIGSETKKAIDVTAKLAKLNRLFLSNSNKELITLKEELDFIKEYVAMEKMRFESDTDFPFKIQINSKVRLTEWLIPPLILQPIVENAIKHGVLVSKNLAEIIIDIQLLNPNSLSIDIINTQAKQSKKRNPGMGLGTQLVADRLTIFNELYPNQFTTKFASGFNDKNEFHANIRIEKKHFDSEGTKGRKSLQNEEFKPITNTLNNYTMGGGSKSL